MSCAEGNSFLADQTILRKPKLHYRFHISLVQDTVLGLFNPVQPFAQYMCENSF